MTEIYNQKNMTANRKQLRNNMVRAEIVLWSKLRNKQLKGLKFRRQYGIGRFIVDFYCVEHKLAIELDGCTHDNSEVYDSERQKFIESYGVKVLRFANHDIYHSLSEVLENIIDNVVTRTQTAEHPSTTPAFGHPSL